MRRFLVILGVLALTATAAAAWLLPVLMLSKPTAEPAAESDADCTSCSLRHGRLGKDEPAD